MENPSFYFWIGLALGAVIGVAAAFLYGKVRGVFSSSEVSRLRQENEELADFYNDHTEKIASGLAEHANKKNSSG